MGRYNRWAKTTYRLTGKLAKLTSLLYYSQGRNDNHKTQAPIKSGPTLRRRMLQEQQQKLKSRRYNFFLLLNSANITRPPCLDLQICLRTSCGPPRKGDRSIARSLFTSTIHPHTQRDMNCDPRCTSATNQYTSWTVFPLRAISDGVNSDPEARLFHTPSLHTTRSQGYTQYSSIPCCQRRSQ